MRRNRHGLRRGGIVVLGLVLALGALSLAPQEARADHPRVSGVVIDGSGVHFYIGTTHHFYGDREYPTARAYFARNRHYRKSVKLESGRDRALAEATRWITAGEMARARRAFENALRFEERRQHELAALDRERERFARGHARHERRWSRAWPW